MIAVFDELQLLHKPLTRLSGGELVPSLEVPDRALLLLEGLANAAIPVIATSPLTDALIRAVHDPDYLDFLENGFEAWRKNPANGPEMRASVHPNIYMNRKPLDLLGRAGYFQADASCVLVEGTWTSVRASAHTAIDAMKRVLAGEGCAYALCRPPGHHAYRDKAGGFCYLNNTAIAAEYAVQQGLRVAIIDVDVHHGNGTQAIFYDRDDVLTVSLHGDPAHLYPFYAGYADELGHGIGEGFNRNIPLPLKSDNHVYLAAVQAACATVRTFGPDVVIIALGLDAASSDPFACMTVDNDGFSRVGAHLGRLCKNTVVVQEGGYPSPHLPGLLESFLTGFIG